MTNVPSTRNSKLAYSRPFLDIFTYIDESARQILNDCITSEDPPRPDFSHDLGPDQDFQMLWDDITARTESFCTGAPLEIFPGMNDYAPLYELLLSRIIFIYTMPDDDEANQLNRPAGAAS